MALEWEPEHWGGSWRAHDERGFVAAHVVPASGDRWLPVVAGDVLPDTYATLEEAKVAAEAAHAVLPPSVPVRWRGPRRWVANSGPEPAPHPGTQKQR